MNAIYARQSLDKKDSISIETQIEFCAKELSIEQSNGGEDPNATVAPLQKYIDKGYSGKNTNRPDFRRLMEDIKRGIIECVVVYRLDRLSRSLLDFSEMMEIFQQHGVEFISTKEKFDTSTPVGKAMLAIIMVFAQLERETIQERVRDNYHARSARGAYDCIAPYGFKKCRIDVGGKKVSTLDINEDTAGFIRNIFEAYGYSETSLGNLARTLNQQDILAPSGGEWDSVKLSRIMANPVYVKAAADVYQYYAASGINLTNLIDDFMGQHGCVTYGKWDRSRRKFDQLAALSLSIGLHPGIVDSQTFLKCQYRLNDNTQIDNSSKGKHSWLTGLIKCGHCTKAMKVLYSSSRPTPPKFVCSGNTNYGICDQGNRPLVSEIEAAVEDQVLEHVKNRIDLTALIIAEEDLVDKRLKIDIAKVEDQIGNLVDAIANGSETAIEYFNERIKKLEAQKQGLLIRRQKHLLSKTSDRDTKQFADILTMWDDMGIEQKHNVVKMLIKKVEVFVNNNNDDESGVQITWKYNLVALAKPNTESTVA